MARTCEACRFWFRHAGNPNGGECRRRAPVLLESGMSDFPATWKECWCGEFEALPALGDVVRRVVKIPRGPKIRA